MIINEKYIQDIDDEDDDDVIYSGDNYVNKKDLDYEFTIKLYNDAVLMQHEYRRFCTLGDCVDYYEQVKDVVEDSFCVDDFYIRATFSHMGTEYTTDEMDEIPMDVEYDGVPLKAPVILLKFNVDDRTRFKEFY